MLAAAGWSSQVARWAHNPEVAGSNPAPATKTSLHFSVFHVYIWATTRGNEARNRLPGARKTLGDQPPGRARWGPGPSPRWAQWPLQGASGAEGYGGAPGAAATRSPIVFRRRLRRLGGSPAAARRACALWRSAYASSTRRLRTTKQQVTNTNNGARPIRRQQPREMSLLAGSLMVE